MYTFAMQCHYLDYTFNAEILEQVNKHYFTSLCQKNI